MTTRPAYTAAQHGSAPPRSRRLRFVVPLWRPAAVLVLALGSAVDIGSSSVADVIRLIGLVLVLTTIGDTLLRALRVRATALQALVLSPLGGVAIVTLLVTWLSVFEPYGIRGWLILASTVLTGGLALTSGARNHRFDHSDLADWALAAATASVPILLYGAIARIPFYLGYDPFTMAAYAQHLADGPVSPFEFSTVWFNHAIQIAAGSYYFTAGAGLLISHNVAGIVRIGGPTLLALTAVLVFLVVKEAFDGRLGAVVAAVLFASSPFVMSRYVMYIRENLALLFFLAVVLILICGRSPLPVGNAVFAAALTGLTIQTHEFVAALTLATWGVYFALNLFTPGRRPGIVRESLIVGSMTAVFALPFAVPVLAQFTPLFVSNQAAGVTGTLNPESPANYIWRRGIQWSDFNWIGFLFAPAGIAMIVRPAMRRNALIVLGPTVGLAIVIAALASAGAPLPTVRLILYLSLVLAVLGGLGAAMLGRLAWESDLRVTAAVAVVLVLGVSLVPVATYRKGTPFLEAQVYGARELALESRNAGWTVLAPFNEVTLLLFAGVDGVVTDRDLVNRVMTATSRAELQAALDAVGLDAHAVYLYADKRVVRDGVRVSPDALGGSSREFTVFTLLRESNPELPLGAEPTVSWPSGPCVELTDLGHAWLLRIERCRN